MLDELAKELSQRGTVEVSDGQVNQVTQALNESDTNIDYLMFGELRHDTIIPIGQACASCDFWKGKFKDTIACQERQGKGATARGFAKIICPHQIVEK